ncbi:MAG: ABC transporter permease [Eubacteriales bacterium]|nr:ABC transporter permease [Eubacteriales bacterium]
MSGRVAIAQKEWRIASRDSVFLVMAILFLIMSIASVYIGSSTKSAELKAYADIVQVARQQGGTAPAAPLIYPLEMLANIVDYIVMIGAVLAIFLGYNAFHSERENGTLRILLTHPLTQKDVVMGKLLGAIGMIGMLLAATFAFNLLLFIAVDKLVPNTEEVARLAICLVMAFTYMMMFYSGALWVSLKARDGGFAFLIMMIVWIFFSFVIPQLADTQRNYAFAISNLSGLVTKMPSETAASHLINLFSPAAQFTNLGNALLQADADNAPLRLGVLLIRQTPVILYLLGCNLALLILLFHSAKREEVLE